ncbi:hypothetical protein EUTSA_v10010839mg [Eutrema salsugineum]|uniref:Uncharacterized protein n=1 Tax=Eutrema salsugineum TaxID=72664 RepID=V4L3J6_EUTSA|nr:hypothetical protein EUTSA_v10010839mg [Eutrema salsugineum]
MGQFNFTLTVTVQSKVIKVGLRNVFLKSKLWWRHQRFLSFFDVSLDSPPASPRLACILWTLHGESSPLRFLSSLVPSKPRWMHRRMRISETNSMSSFSPSAIVRQFIWILRR